MYNVSVLQIGEIIMRQFTTLVFFMLLTFTVAQSEDFWEFVNTPNDNEIGDAAVAPNGDLYACGLGIYRSTDKGKTWMGINKIVFNGIEVYFDETGNFFTNIEVTKAGTILVGLGDGYAWRSTDQGQTWLILPEDFQNLEGFLIDGNDRIYIANDYSVMYSDDQGANWEESPGFEESRNSIDCLAFDADSNIVALGMGKVYVKQKDEEGFVCDSNAIYSETNPVQLATGNSCLLASTYQDGFIRSLDGGKSWQNLGNKDVSSKVRYLCTGPNGYFYACMNNGGIIYSTDNGSNWTLWDETFGNMEVNHLLFYGSDVLVSGLGLYLREGSSQWAQISEGLGKPIASAIGKTNTDKYYIGTMKSIYVSGDKFQTWEQISTSGIDYSLSRYADNTLIDKYGNLFLSTSKGLYRRADNGQSWDSIAGFDNIKTLKEDSRGNIYILNLFDGVFYSSDKGQTWNPVIDDWMIIYMSVRDDDALVVGTDNLIMTTKNNGQSWDTIQFNAQSESMMIEESFISGDTIIIYDRNTNMVFFSKDKGKSSRSLTNGLDDPLMGELDINDIAMFNGQLLLSSDYGIYKYDFAAEMWTIQISGMSKCRSYTFKDIGDGHLYVATYKGLYRTKETVNTIEDDQQFVNTDLLAFPNPAGEYISLAGLNGDAMEISITDVKGTEQEVIQSRNSVNLGNLPAGLYFITVRDNQGKLVGHSKFIKK